MAAAALILAAGRGSRFGDGVPKLLTPIDGVPMIERTMRSALDAGCDPVVVVVAAQSAIAALAIFSDPRIRAVVNPDPARGMFSSVQIGLAHATGDPVLIIPGDMPFIAPATIALVRAEAERRGAIVSPRWRGTRGHPVALPEAVRADVLAADAASTLSQVLARHEPARVAIDVDDSGILRDVDVPADLGGGERA